jgi:hypothetical protein
MTGKVRGGYLLSTGSFKACAPKIVGVIEELHSVQASLVRDYLD